MNDFGSFSPLRKVFFIISAPSRVIWRETVEMFTELCYNETKKGGGKMQYYERSNKKLHFIVTPDELRKILQGFHHVVVNTGVRKNYVESNPNDFLFTYDTLYEKLKNGVKLVWKTDYDIVDFSTGITNHLENCIYKTAKTFGINSKTVSKVKKQFDIKNKLLCTLIYIQ